MANRKTREPLGKGESRPGSNAQGQDILPCDPSIVAVHFHNRTSKYCNSTKLI